MEHAQSDDGRLGTARDDVVEVLAAFARGLDTKDWALLGDLLTDDCHAYGRRGRTATLQVIADHLGGCGATQHLLGNHRVILAADGRTADVSSYARVYHAGAGDLIGDFFECMGEYTDRLVLTGDGWKLDRRSFAMEITLGNRAVLGPHRPGR